MTGFFKKHIRKLALSTIIIVAITIGCVHIIWRHYVNTTFNPVLDILRVTGEPTDVYQGRQLRTYFFRDWNEGEYSFTVSVPRFLFFGGHITIQTLEMPQLIDGSRVDPSNIMVTIFPWQGTNTLSLPMDSVGRLDEREWRLEMEAHYDKLAEESGFRVLIHDDAYLGSSYIWLYSSVVDNYGSPLGRQFGEDINDYLEWLVIHKRHYYRIMSLFADVKKIFGDNIFPS